MTNVDQIFVSEVGARLRQKREKLGLSLEQASSGAGIHRNSLQFCETGKVACTIDTLVKLCRFLRVSPNWALFGEEKFSKRSKQEANL